jgi:hypothetical protein
MRVPALESGAARRSPARCGEVIRARSATLGPGHQALPELD